MSDGRRRVRRHGPVAAAVTIATAVLALATPAPGHAQAGGATPAAGTVGPASGSTTTWTFDPIAGAGSGGTPLEVACAPGQCSRFDLTLRLPQPDAAFYRHFLVTLTYRCSWNEPAPTDVDCFAFSPQGSETAGPGKPDTNDANANYEEISVVDPPSGVWSLRADAGAAVPLPTVVTGVATLTISPAPSPPARATLSDDPRFANTDFDPAYQTHDLLGRPNAGEPSIGVDQATGAVLYMAGNQVTRITYDQSSPPHATFTDVTPPDSQVNEDAILVTDRDTHRTWALGLLLAGSYAAYTDDDGATWTPAVAISPPALPDHETLGSGPYHQPAPAHSYAHAVYYCAQTIVQDAYCGRSDDGGVSFSAPATPLWNGVCSPIHGHVRVGPTGIVYVPNSSCTDSKGVARSGVAVSVDNGQSFTVSMPPDSSPGTSDPSVMEGPDGVVYFGYQASNGHPMLATATHDADGTLHWRPSVDVGAVRDPGETEDGLPFGVQNTEFSEVVTGDPGRAAFAFIGTGRPGAYQDGSFTGTWYLFVSYTFDGGRTWRTVNATPNDPVQRGCVWNGGLVNACRNMLDFNDIGIDRQGRVYVSYTDGCTTTAAYSCDTTPVIAGWNAVDQGDAAGGCPPSEAGSTTSTSTCTFGRLSAVVRQVCGRGLVAASDPGFDESPSCAGAARTTVSIPPSAGSPPPSAVQAASSPSVPNTAAARPGPAGGTVALGALGFAVAAGRRRRRTPGRRTVGGRSEE